MKHLEINSGIGGGGVGIGMSEIAALEDKWEGTLNEFAARIDGMDVFSGGRWFRSRMDCVDVAVNHITVGQFQWFLDIVSYLQFDTGGEVSTSESQQDKVHAEKVWKTKEQSIFTLVFKTDVPPILGGLGEGKE